MEDEEDERYAVSTYVRGYRKKLPVRNAAFSRASEGSYHDEEEDENSEEEVGNGVEDIDDEEDDLEFRSEEDEIKRHPKKRKLKSLISTYEFAPRVPSAPKQATSGRNPLTDWSERETKVLLEAWGDKFLEHGRKSLRSDEWASVAEEVSKTSKVERTDTQCRNRLDTLKKKYKKEKAKAGEMKRGSGWVFFGRMDELMGGRLGRRGGSESGEDSEGLPPKKRRSGRGNSESSFRLLAESISKFSEIYEKTESSKREQAMELEKMKMEMHRDLELQRKKMMDEIRAQIANLVDHQDDRSPPRGKST